MPIITGRTACEIAATGLGGVTGAIGTGGNLAAILLTGGAGFLLGKVVCRIPALEKAFDRALGTDDWRLLEMTLADPAVREQAVAAIATETALTPTQAASVWDAIVTRLHDDPKSLVQADGFDAARHHPATGAMAHGVATIARSAAASSA